MLLECPLLQAATGHSFTVCPPRTLSRFDFDFSAFAVGIVSSFALFVPPRIISQIPFVNIHPSLLPRWRGPAPIQFTLLAGDREAGVSIIDLHPKEIDAGNLLAQKRLEIEQPSCTTYLELESKLAQLGGQLAAEVIDQFEHFWSNKQPQPTKDVTKTCKIGKEDGLINFSTQTSEEIDRKVRALAHQIPIKCILSSGRTVFLEEAVFPACTVSKDLPHFYDKTCSALFIKTADGFIGFKFFKIEGKAVIYPAGAFYANFLKNKDIHFS